VLNSIEWEVRRQTLLAQRQEREGAVVYRFDVVVQHHDMARETVFFEV
jgi:protocatechuate 3,4-dioxygenase alpha subunit